MSAASRPLVNKAHYILLFFSSFIMNPVMDSSVIHHRLLVDVSPMISHIFLTLSRKCDVMSVRIRAHCSFLCVSSVQLLLILVFRSDIPTFTNENTCPLSSSNVR